MSDTVGGGSRQRLRTRKKIGNILEIWSQDGHRETKETNNLEDPKEEREGASNRVKKNAEDREEVGQRYPLGKNCDNEVVEDNLPLGNWFIKLGEIYNIILYYIMQGQHQEMKF